MFLKIFAWFWIITGVFFLIKPDFLRRRLQKKGLKRMRKFFIIIAVFLGGFLISIGFNFKGFMAKVLVVFGALAILKGLFFMKSKAADKMLEWSAKKPLIYFRIGSLFYLFTGIALLMLKH